MGKLTEPVEWAKAVIVILDWLKAQTKEVCILLMLSGLAVFLPTHWLNKMNLNPQNYTYHVFATWVLWGSFLYLTVFGGADLIRRIEKMRRLRSLGKDEKNVLGQLIHDGSYSRCFQAGEVGTNSLEAVGILFPAPRSNAAFPEKDMLCYSIEPWIFRYLKKRPHLITPS